MASRNLLSKYSLLRSCKQLIAASLQVITRECSELKDIHFLRFPKLITFQSWEDLSFYNISVVQLVSLFGAVIVWHPNTFFNPSPTPHCHHWTPSTHPCIYGSLKMRPLVFVTDPYWWCRNISDKNWLTS